MDSVSIGAIIGRIQAAPWMQEYIKNPPRFGDPRSYRAPREASPIPKFPPMTEAEKQTLFEISQNPTEQELKDIALVDDLFTQDFAATYTTTEEVCFYASQSAGRLTSVVGPKGGRYPAREIAPGVPLPDAPEIALIRYLNPGTLETVGPRGGRYAARPTADVSFLKNKFWCPEPEKPWSTGGFASQFGIDTTKPWGETKLAVQNGLTMLEVKKDYPWPPPIGTHPNFLWRRLFPLLPKIANIGMRLDPEAFKAWLTMATLEHYDSVTDEIIAYEKKKAKKKKRNAIIKAVAFAIAGLVLSFIVPAILAAAVSAIKAAVDAYVSVQERKKAAKALADAARMFQEDAPKFAAEVQKTADMMDSAAAQEAAAAPLTPEQLEAIQEVEEETPGTPTGTYVIGGVAATGLIAALVTLLR